MIVTISKTQDDQRSKTQEADVFSDFSELYGNLAAFFFYPLQFASCSLKLKFPYIHSYRSISEKISNPDKTSNCHQKTNSPRGIIHSVTRPLFICVCYSSICIHLFVILYQCKIFFCQLTFYFVSIFKLFFHRFYTKNESNQHHERNRRVAGIHLHDRGVSFLTRERQFQRKYRVPKHPLPIAMRNLGRADLYGGILKL